VAKTKTSGAPLAKAGEVAPLAKVLESFWSLVAVLHWAALAAGQVLSINVNQQD